MKKLLTIVVLSILLVSCASRRVSVQKSEVKTSTDSVAVEKKDSIAIEQKAIEVKEEIDEIEITPIDTTKPIIIGDKKYFNAKLRLKKTKKSLVDSTKTIVAKTQEKAVQIQKKENKQDFNKQVDKGANYWWLLWLLLIPLAIWLFKRFRPWWI